MAFELTVRLLRAGARREGPHLMGSAGRISCVLFGPLLSAAQLLPRVVPTRAAAADPRDTHLARQQQAAGSPGRAHSSRRW